MTIRHLKIFLTVAETGKNEHGRRTALYHSALSQPGGPGNWKTTTRYCSLNASPKNFISLKTGKKLYVTAKQLVTQFENLEESMRKENRREKIRIGGTVTLGSGLLSKVVRDLRGERPELDIYSYMNNTQIIEQKLLNMELDVGIVEGRVKSRDLVSIPLIDDMLVLACGQKSPLLWPPHLIYQRAERT